MFIGHFAVGLLCKRAAPRASLGTFFVAAQFLDLLWPVFLMLGLETVSISPGLTEVTPLDFVSYPFSHSLVASLLWAIAFGSVYYALRHRPRESIFLALCLLSHWLLDFITHRPDLPLTFWSDQKVGLGLWSSRGATLGIEVPFFLAAIAVYSKGTAFKDNRGRYGLWAFAALLLIMYVVSIFGPPPPDVKTLAWSAHFMWLLVAAGFWIDRHRESVARPS